MVYSIIFRNFAIIEHEVAQHIIIHTNRRYMKITKIKTLTGELGAPVSTEISAIIEQMQSPKTKEAAARIAAVALQQRLAMQQGAPRYHLEDCDRLPYLVFSTTFGKGGFSSPISFN